jgi:hypothetical protein
MSAKLTVLIVGGYGTFGARTVRLLEHDKRLTVLVAGRSWKKAHALCKVRAAAKADLVPAAFDRSGDLDRQLEILRPDILVDASGPFQAYGNRPYALIEACIAHGIHYLDLADGSDFVAGVSAFDDAARDKGVYALSGASSFPVLTAAAVRRLSADMLQVDSITGGIAPSPHARVGLNVIRAIAGYAGKRVPLKRDGRPSFGYPFTEQIRFTVAPPGHVPLKSTLFSLVDVPDLRALAELWPEAKTIWMGAGPVPQMLHRMLIGLAWLTRLRLLPSLLPLTRVIHFVSNHLVWGEHRGGMFVEVKGVDRGGAPVTRSWNLIAEGDHGPLIPSMAVAALIRKVLEGHRPVAGARAASGDLELDDYEPLFNERRIVTGLRDEPPPSTPIQQRILGAAWNQLPRAIAAMHEVTSAHVAEGRADVDRGTGLVAKLIAAAIGLPKPGRNVPVSVRFEQVNDAELWTRTFGNRSFSSMLFEARGRTAGLLCERFGSITFRMALAVRNDRVDLVPRGWTLFGVPMPRWLSPRTTAYETVQDGRFRFFVEIRLPWGALIVRYRGWLVRAGDQDAAPKRIEVAEVN